MVHSSGCLMLVWWKKAISALIPRWMMNAASTIGLQALVPRHSRQSWSAIGALSRWRRNENSIRRQLHMMYDLNAVRLLYRKLITLYPRDYKEQLGESMEQTFNDLCKEQKTG